MKSIQIKFEIRDCNIVSTVLFQDDSLIERGHFNFECKDGISISSCSCPDFSEYGDDDGCGCLYLVGDSGSVTDTFSVDNFLDAKCAVLKILSYLYEMDKAIARKGIYRDDVIIIKRGDKKERIFVNEEILLFLTREKKYEYNSI